MSLTPTAATLATAGIAQVRELPMSPYAYWAISFGAFLLLLGVLWSFRNTAARFDAPIRVGRDDNGGQGDPHGSSEAADPGAHH